MKLQGQININIALKKVCIGRVNAGILSHDFSDTVKSFKNIVWVKQTILDPNIGHPHNLWIHCNNFFKFLTGKMTKR